MMSHLHAQSHKRSLMRGRGVRTTVLLLVTLIVLIPFVYMLCSAFKTGTEINSWPPTIFPRAFRRQLPNAFGNGAFSKVLCQ